LKQQYDQGYLVSMGRLSTGGGVPIRQEKLAPTGLEFSEAVSPARWVEESLEKFGNLSSMLPAGFSAYARVFHPAYLADSGEQPVRWSTVASWTGRTVHPRTQFEYIANLGADFSYPDPPWGHHPSVGSIPEAECRTLVNVLREFTSTPGQCWFCLWEGYGYLDSRLYKPGSRVKAPGRDYLLFRGSLDSVMSFIIGEFPFWGDSPNIWWPEDRTWCVATDIDLADTYVAGSRECIEAVLTNPYLEALLATRDAPLGMDKDTINAPDSP
jgi:hypothetical protein